MTNLMIKKSMAARREFCQSYYFYKMYADGFIFETIRNSLIRNRIFAICLLKTNLDTLCEVLIPTMYKNK